MKKHDTQQLIVGFIIIYRKNKSHNDCLIFVIVIIQTVFTAQRTLHNFCTNAIFMPTD